ncbi:MAG: hypothetical protein LBM93_05185 [Oscillospiraceae bacterium]|jgi:preprotein translocase subunit SecG|nr:hypothetical protein [Oscillospiraceae bacterium]
MKILFLRLLKKALKCFAIVSILIFLLYIVLEFMDLYRTIQQELDLKYDSWFIRIPLIGTAIICILFLLIGILLYNYHYKRPRSKKTDFFEELSKKLD